jgi:hypothetical protein
VVGDYIEWRDYMHLTAAYSANLAPILATQLPDLAVKALEPTPAPVPPGPVPTPGDPLTR